MSLQDYLGARHGKHERWERPASGQTKTVGADAGFEGVVGGVWGFEGSAVFVL